MRAALPNPSVVVVHDERSQEMAFAMMIDNPQGSQELYEKIRAHIGLQKPAGGIFHIAGPSPNGGWRVIEVWESEEEAQRFIQEQFIPEIGRASCRESG